MASKYEWEIPKTPRTKIKTFGDFKKNELADPKNALKTGGKVGKTQNVPTDLKKQNISTGLKVNKAVYEDSTELAGFTTQLTQLKEQLESLVSDFRRVSGDLYRKGLEPYSAKLESLVDGISNSLDGFDSLFSEIKDQVPAGPDYLTGHTAGKLPDFIAEDDNQDPIVAHLAELKKNIDEITKRKDTFQKQVDELNTQISQLTVKMSQETANYHTNILQKQQQPAEGQPAGTPTPAPVAQPTATV